MSVNLKNIDNSYKILIVDDVPANILLLRAQLKSENHQIVTAENGVIAIEMVKKELPDLILLDIMMPEMDGYEVSKYLKNVPEYKNIPIIFLTALNNSESIIEGFLTGGSDLITKPFKKEELITKVNNQILRISLQRKIKFNAKEIVKKLNIQDANYKSLSDECQAYILNMMKIINILLESVTSSACEDLSTKLVKIDSMLESLISDIK